MPIKVPDNLPAKDILINENIFVMNESRAFSQNIRPLKIVILNLMPNKQETEVQLLRLIGNTPLQIEVTLLHMESHISKNTSIEYLENFYDVYENVKHLKYDGMIITGAPVEQLEFEEVNYWEELKRIMDWTTTSVTSTFHICWGAQAGLYHHYGVPKYALEKKISGVFLHTKVDGNINLLKGFDEQFYVPHSRYTNVKKDDIMKVDGLDILSTSEESGVYLVVSKDGKRIFATGHLEYDRRTLHNEYVRDSDKGLNPQIPKNYYRNDNPKDEPLLRWRSHANLLYTNWLNYYVYQETPYEL